MSAHSILVVEDEEDIAEAVRARLASEGFHVRVATDGPQALGIASAERPDLVVLDLMLPGMDGLEVCRELQRTEWTPVLMLTARTDEADKVAGFAVGADDYLTKPFSPRELVARVKTVLRRTTGTPGADAVLTVGRVRLDPGRRRVWAGEREVALTTTEFDLLAYLMRRPGRVYEREQLLSEVWGYAAAAGTRTVDVHVAQLRGKLGETSPIRTVRGVGYAAESP